MSTNLRYPNITGMTDRDKLAQVQSYLHQLVDQLNYALKNMESGGSGATLSTAGASSKTEKQIDATSTFKSIKSLIIKSADIVNAYYEEINKKLSGLYVAESDFGKYTEKTDLLISTNSKNINQYYNNIQEIISDVDGLEHKIIEVNAHVNSGLLYYDENEVPVYGLEIGQRTEIDGVEVFRKYARFTSDRLSFYDQNNKEVAYISDKKLYITYIEVNGSYKIGYLEDTALSDGSVVTRYKVSEVTNNGSDTDPDD